jgi:predicted Zn-dependent protease
VHTHASGLCLDDPEAKTQLAYISSADPADAARLVRGALPPERETDSPPHATAPGGAHRGAALEAAVAFHGTVAARVAPAEVRVLWVASRQRVTIARDDGLVVSDLRAGFRLRIDGFSEKRGHRVTATVELARGEPPVPGDPRLVQLAERLADGLDRRGDLKPAPRGEATIVLAPGLGGIWAHELFGHALEGDERTRGRCWLAGLRPGVLPEELRVSDDPRLCRTPIAVDDQGTATSNTRLIGSGRLASALHDRESAARDRHTPTGHGRRASFRDPVLPRMSCTFVEAGTMTAEEILSGVDDGIHVRRMEAGAADTASGRATFRVVDADRIRRGALAGPLEAHVLEIQAGQGFRGLRIADDLDFDTCVGSCHRDGQTLITSVGAPTLCLGMVGVVR